MPTPQDTLDPQFDDEEILSTDELLRVCKTLSQVVLDRATGRYVVSTQAFSALGPGISVDIVSLYEAAGHTDQDRTTAQGAYSAMRISVAAVRETEARNSDGKPIGKFKVAYTPLNKAAHGNDDPFHGDIFPRSTGAANKALTKRAVQVVEVDQALAAAALARRHG